MEIRGPVGGRRLEMESQLVFCGRELEARVSWIPEDRWEEVGDGE
jgi:hypothetical protein